jgi:hypothetical protein
MRKFPRSAVVLTLINLVAAAGCETGKEVAAVESAVAHRDVGAAADRGSDDTVTVTMALKCQVIRGMGRTDDTCDADGSEVCVLAEWFEVDDVTFARPILQARQCARVPRIRGARLTVRSASPVRKSPPLKIRVATWPVPVVIDSP